MTHPAWLLLSAIGLAQALPQAQPADQTIVITGTKPTKDAIAHYVDAITAKTDGQLARFRDPICPASFGLPHAYNRIIDARLREDARRAGLRVAGESCDANVVLIVADDPVPLVKALRRERPQMFIGVEFDQIRSVLMTEEPVRTWHTIEPRGSDGRPLQRIMLVGTRPVGGEGAWQNPTASNSRIEQNIQADLVSSFVLVEAKAIDGLTLTQIADYAAMRALAQTHAPASPGGPTILSLFNRGSESVSELTRWDIAYLRSLYMTDNRRAAHSQEAAMKGAIERGLDRTRGKARDPGR